MKQITNAVKQYFSISFVWWTPLLILSELMGIAALAALSSLFFLVDTDSRLLMGILAYIHIYVMTFFMMGAMRTADNKFFSSSSHAKQFSTIVPIISALILSLPLDLILLIATPSDMRAEFMIVNALNTVVVCLLSASQSKSGLQICGLILFVLFLMQYRLWTIPALKDGSGISIPAAVIISLIIYIGGTALNIYIMDMWWEKSGRRMTGKDGVTRDISVIKKILCFLDN